MPVGLIGGAVSGIGSLVGGLLGDSASGNAAKAIQSGIGQAEAYQKQQTANAVSGQTQATNQIGNELSPYTGLGAQSAGTLSSLLAPGGALTQGWNQTFQAPTAEQAAQTPGYQFQLQQGQNALQNSAAARGGLLSSGTAKALDQYSQGLASSNYQNTYNNALQTYGTNYNTFQNNQNNLYNRLAGTTQLGLGATSNLASLQQQGANSLSNIYQNSGQQIGNDLTQAGQAQAAGIVGGSNALTGGLQGGLNALGQGITLAQQQGAQNASGGQSSLSSLVGSGGVSGANGVYVPNIYTGY